MDDNNSSYRQASTRTKSNERYCGTGRGQLFDLETHYHFVDLYLDNSSTTFTRSVLFMTPKPMVLNIRIACYIPRDRSVFFSRLWRWTTRRLRDRTSAGA